MTIRICSALTLTFVTASASFGQTNTALDPYTLPTVTVIGHAPELQQDESVSASVVAGDLFDWGGFRDTRELTTIAPNTSMFDGNNQRTPRFSVRGFRENNFLIGEPAVGLYVDDVPFTDVASRGLPLYDIDQAEFYRGPQGTLFGVGGIGGVMNIRTIQPGNGWHGGATAGYGSYNEQNYQAGIGGPIASNKLYFGVSGVYGGRDGFVKNLNLGTDADNRETLSGRAVMRWTPTEQWDVALTLTAERYRDDFIAAYYPTTNYPSAVSDSGPFDVNRNIDGFNNTDAFGQALRVRYEAGDFSVVSITTHRGWEQDLLQDFDFTSLEIRNGFSRPEVESWSQELRVQSPDAGEAVQWLGGVFFANTTVGADSGSVEFFPVPLSPGFVSGPPTTLRTLAESQGQTYALFGQTTWSATDKLDLTAGLRLNREVRKITRQKTISSPNSTFGGFPAGPFQQTYGAYDTDLGDTAIMPKIGASWHFSDDVLGYFTFGGGYQSGGFNASNDDPVESRFDPATSWNYELGLKSDWADRCFSANFALFYSDVTDYQVYRLNAADPTQAYIQNADRAALMGAELELSARPAEGWEFTGGVGYTHAEYDRYFDSVNNVSLDGNAISFVPEFTANLAGQYSFPSGFYVRLEMQALGDYYLTEDNTAKQAAFALLNARVGYDTRNWGVYVYARNILDKEYASNALDLRRQIAPGQLSDDLILQPGNPVTVGVAVTARF